MLPVKPTPKDAGQMTDAFFSTESLSLIRVIDDDWRLFKCSFRAIAFIGIKVDTQFPGHLLLKTFLAESTHRLFILGHLSSPPGYLRE
jgi:hypothetical protein